MMSNTIRIGFISNELIIRVGIQTLLKQTGLPIELAFVASHWTQAPHPAFIDVLIVDDITPITEIKSIISKFHNLWDRPGIVVITDEINGHYFETLLKANVKVCLHRRDMSVKHLREAVLEGFNGDQFLSPIVAAMVHETTTIGQPTRDDLRLLRLLSQGYPVHHACHSLNRSQRWGYKSLGRMRRLLNVPNNALLIATAREQGLISREDA